MTGWGPGVWALSETQLSAVTQVSTRKALVCQGRRDNRQVRVHMGAAAQLRPSSSWAGAWSGVLQASDFPCHSVRLAWPTGAYETGRVQVVLRMIAQTPVMVANVYGYCPGPTWPKALQQTDDLLATLTREVVLGSSSVRMIVGDMNHPADKLAQVELWQQMGWVECQAFAHQAWGQPVCNTCKGSTVRDYSFLSPEAQSLLAAVQVFDTFQEHSTVCCALRFPDTATPTNSWPLAREIPWHDVDLPAWQHQTVHSTRNSKNRDQSRLTLCMSIATTPFWLLMRLQARWMLIPPWTRVVTPRGS